MCSNATKTAADLMSAIEPTLKSLLAYANILDREESQLAIEAFDAAVRAVHNWQSGSPEAKVLEVIGDFQQIFATVSPLLPPTVGPLVNIVLAGVATVLGIIQANSPAPGDAPAHLTSVAAKEAYQVHVIAQTADHVHTLVPSFQRSIWHSAASQYKKAWNDAVHKDGLPKFMAA
jgi:hypothetical protein